MTDIEAGDTRAGPHGIAFGQGHAGLGFGIEKAEKRRLFRMVRLGWIAGRRPDAPISLAHEFITGETLVGSIAPAIPADPLMHAPREGLRKPVGTRHHQAGR